MSYRLRRRPRPPRVFLDVGRGYSSDVDTPSVGADATAFTSAASSSHRAACWTSSALMSAQTRGGTALVPAAQRITVRSLTRNASPSWRAGLTGPYSATPTAWRRSGPVIGRRSAGRFQPVFRLSCGGASMTGRHRDGARMKMPAWPIHRHCHHRRRSLPRCASCNSRFSRVTKSSVVCSRACCSRRLT